MDLLLSDRTCLVTGASAGIGAGVARVLAAEGVRLAINARRGDLLQVFADELASSGAERPIVIPGSLTSPDGPREVGEAAIEALGGRIDILVNAAGGSRTLALDAGEAAWDEAMTLNFHSVRRLCETIIPGMQARKWGRVINITGSMEPRTLNGAVTAKAALHLWSKGLSCDLAADGVTINCIPPGRINSEQILQRVHPTEESRKSFIARNIPIGYFGEPEDIGRLVAFLASPLARYITGTVIPVDGGMHAFGH